MFASAGYEVVFVDIDAALVHLLNEAKGYHLKMMADPPYRMEVTNVRAVYGGAEEAIVEEIASCDIMAVSLGAALVSVASVISRGLALRKKHGRALNILLCENLKNAADHMRGWLTQSLPDDEAVLSSCGLVETVVGRMVPVAPVAEASPESLSLAVEEYGFLPIDKDAFIGEIPDVPGLLPCSPFSFYVERKLYLHNMGHACCAYLGMLRGYDTIAESIEDPFIYSFVKSAMTESASMLSERYGVPFETVFRHAESLLFRFANRSLLDTCARVGRDPLRKLQPHDRFAGALRACAEHGIHPVYIACGLAAALLSLTEDPGQARKIVAEQCALAKEQQDLVMSLWASLQKEGDFAALFRMAQKEKARIGKDFA